MGELGQVPQREEPGRTPDGQTLIAPARDLALRAPLGWLAAGWRDYWAAPAVSLAWGGVVFAVSAALSWLAWRIGGWILLLTLLTGFVFVAPLLAFALYSVPRLLCEGRTPTFGATLRAVRRPFQNAMVFGLILLVVFLVWARAGSMVHVFFPVSARPELADVLRFFAIGSAAGAVFASVSFAATAFSLPMLANRDVDVVTAVISSVNAVLRNKFSCAIWAGLIATLTALGILAGLAGLALVIPWLAYASWHAYREAVDVSSWPKLPGEGPGAPSAPP